MSDCSTSFSLDEIFPTELVLLSFLDEKFVLFYNKFISYTNQCAVRFVSESSPALKGWEPLQYSRWEPFRRSSVARIN